MLLCCGCLSLRAEPIDEIGPKFRAELDRYVAERDVGADDDGRWAGGMADLAAMLGRPLDGESVQYIGQALRQLEALPDLPPTLRESAAAYRAALPEIIERQEAEYVAAVDAAIERTRKECLVAKAENDLNDLLMDLGKLKQTRSGSDLAQRAARKIQSAATFVARWQDYLAQLASGNAKAARSILDRMDDSGGEYPILTREQIGARISHLPPTEDDQSSAGPSPLEVARTITTLEQVAPVLAESVRNSRNDSRFSQLHQQLAEVAYGYAALSQGRYADAMQPALAIQSSHEWSPEVLRLRGKLLEQTLPYLLGLSPDARPADGETPSDYLLRMAGEAQAEGKWSDVQRYLETYRRVAFPNPTPEWLSTDIESCESYLAGQSQEAAGQWSRAIASYERAVKLPGKFAPSGTAGERLAALEKEHPEVAGEANRLRELREIVDTLRKEISKEVRDSMERSQPRRGRPGYP